jgi:hypothetical protein
MSKRSEQSRTRYHITGQLNKPVEFVDGKPAIDVEWVCRPPFLFHGTPQGRPKGPVHGGKFVSCESVILAIFL